MKEEDPFEFIYRIEERAWERLRESGLSDKEVWDIAVQEDGSTWKDRPFQELSETELIAAEILEAHLIYEKFDNGEFSQYELDWLAIGYTLGSLNAVAQLERHDRNMESRKQSERGSGPKDRPTLGKDVVAHVFGMIPPAKHNYPGFEEYICADCTLNIDGLEVGVIAESYKGKVIRFGFELPGVRDPEWYQQVSIRSIITRLNK